MSKIDILIGTTLGNAEYVADELANTLTQSGHDVHSHLNPSLNNLQQNSLWLIVSSTHGSGDLPDNIQPFFDEIEKIKPDLSHQKFSICAIGDSSYDTFCLGPAKLESLLNQCAARPFVDKIEIDIQTDPIPEEAALSWIQSWADRL